MGRIFVGASVFLIAIVVCRSAYAGDRPSGARKVQTAMSLRYEVIGAQAGQAPPGRSSAAEDRRTSSARATENAVASANEHKPLTLFRVRSRFREIALQPILGQINGAQFSLGF